MCMICLNQSKGSNFIKLPCQHLFCVKCMETLCKMHVKEGSLFQLVCPDTKCNISIPHNLLKRLLSVEEFERWDRLALQKALKCMADVVYCPKCEVGCLQDDDNNAQCPKCSFTFCGLCKELWHPGKQCLTSNYRTKAPAPEGVRQVDPDGDGTGNSEHQRTVQRCSVMSHLSSGHQQNLMLQQNDVHQLWSVILLSLLQGNKWLQSLQELRALRG